MSRECPIAIDGPEIAQNCSKALKLRVHAYGDDGHGAAIGVVAGVLDPLVVETQVSPRTGGGVIVDLDNLLGSGMRQPAVAAIGGWPQMKPMTSTKRIGRHVMPRTPCASCSASLPLNHHICRTKVVTRHPLLKKAGNDQERERDHAERP